MEIIWWDLLVLTMSRFLLAVLHIESLASQLNKAAVRNALDKLPQGLDDTYDEALQRIQRQGQPSVEMAYRVLSWISYAYRPLTVEGLRCALAVTPGHFTFDEDAMTPESTLVSICAGLVTVDTESKIIRLVHYTTQEFFERFRDSRFPTAQADITLICLAYLSFDHSSYEYIYYWEKTPFLQYATRYWRDHMRATPETGINYVNELIIQILLQPRTLRALLSYVYEGKRPWLGPLALVEDSNVPPLCAAAILGLESIVVLLLERDGDSTKSVIKDGETALHTAAYFAQLEVMKILIDHGASVNDHVWTPLSGAISSIYFRGNGMHSEEGAVAAVRLLLARGADVNLQSDYQYGYTFSPLIQAAMTGSIQLVELLLKYGADVHVRFWHGLTVLHEAHSGKPGIFQLLVDHGADLHACDDYGESPLLRLCHDHSREPEDTVRMLLDLGADIHSRNNLGETFLFRAAERGFCRMIEVLMEYGADIHARNKFGRSVLFSAIASPYYGADRVVPSLLHFGADVHLQDSAGDTALGLAAAKGLDGTVKLVLEHNPNINTCNGAVDTALTLAATNGKMDAVKLLLEHGANIHICNGTGDTALTLAAAREAIPEGFRSYYRYEAFHTEHAFIMAADMKSSLIAIEFLLNRGASVDLKNNAGDTALTLAAAARGNLDAVKLLLEHGANIDTRNGAGDTALTLAAAADAMLVEWTGYDGRRETIHNAILTAGGIKGNSTLIELFLDHGASINLKDKAGDTALTLAAGKGKLDAVKLLLNRGADAHAKNEAGDTALSLANQNGHSELHQLLLEHVSEPNQAPVGSGAE